VKFSMINQPTFVDKTSGSASVGPERPVELAL
jgi:hypothetical protein